MIGPFALKVIAWQYQHYADEEHSTAGDEMAEGGAMDVDEPSQHGVWAVGDRWRSDDELEPAY